MANIKLTTITGPSGKWDKRFVVVDADTGELLDDAQGYGYKTAQGAYAAYGYKNRDKSKDAAKAKTKRAVQRFCKDNPKIVAGLEALDVEILKGSWGPDEKFNAKLVGEALKGAGFTDLPFTAGEFLKYWSA